jgi:hypothetical protein
MAFSCLLARSLYLSRARSDHAQSLAPTRSLTHSLCSPSSPPQVVYPALREWGVYIGGAVIPPARICRTTSAPQPAEGEPRPVSQ